MVRMRRPFTLTSNLAYTPTRAHGRTHNPAQGDPLSLVLQNSGTLVTIEDTTTPTTVFSRTITGGLIGADEMLRLTLFCDVLFNNNIADTLTMRIRWGSPLLTEANMAPAALSATRRIIAVTVLVANRNSLTSQNVMYRAECDVNFATGRPVLVGLAQDTQQTQYALTLAVTFLWSAASMNNSLRVFQGVLEKL